MTFDFEKWLRAPAESQGASTTSFKHDPRYDALPESLKLIYTPEQYAWFSEEEKATLLERNCMPEVEE